VAVANQKGGVGKTTTAVNLAASLAEMGKRILVIDLDGQCNATSWLAVEDGRGILDLFEGTVHALQNIAVETRIPGISLIPASRGLANLDRALATEPGAEHILRTALTQGTDGRWDLVVIDCPPALGLATLNGLAAATTVLVPCETSSLGLAGLDALLETVDKVRLRVNPSLELLGVVPTKADLRTRLTRTVIETLRDRFGDVLLHTPIRHSVRYLEAPAHNQPIGVYEPNGRGAEDCRAVAQEIAQRLRHEDNASGGIANT
jgi:chromosome partitioning protein